MRKINVAIAGFPSELAMTVALAVCQSSDMCLCKHGLAEDSFANHHLKIACTYMEMYSAERTNIFFEQEADVLVDCFSSESKERDKLCAESKIPLVIIGLDLTAEEILESIRELSKVTV